MFDLAVLLWVLHDSPLELIRNTCWLKFVQVTCERERGGEMPIAVIQEESTYGTYIHHYTTPQQVDWHLCQMTL